LSVWDTTASRNSRTAYAFATIARMRALVPLMSGSLSPAAIRGSRTFSSCYIPIARSAAERISDGFSTSTPFSSARIASPGLTDTPPQETGTQNSPLIELALAGDDRQAATPDRQAVLAQFLDVSRHTVDNDPYAAGSLGRKRHSAAEHRVPRIPRSVHHQNVTWSQLSKSVVVRVVEIERCGAVVCPTGYGVAEAPFNSATHRTSAMPGFGASSESGFTRTGRVHIARPFILPSFSPLRQP
jgi:hypothetical protein